MNGKLDDLQRQVRRLETAVVILASAIHVRSDRNITLNDSALGIAVDLLADGSVADAINYYDHTRRHS